MDILKPSMAKFVWLVGGVLVAKFVLPKLPAPLKLG